MSGTRSSRQRAPPERPSDAPERRLAWAQYDGKGGPVTVIPVTVIPDCQPARHRAAKDFRQGGD